MFSVPTIFGAFRAHHRARWLILRSPTAAVPYSSSTEMHMLRKPMARKDTLEEAEN